MGLQDYDLVPTAIEVMFKEQCLEKCANHLPGKMCVTFNLCSENGTLLCYLKETFEQAAVMSMPGCSHYAVNIYEI